MSYLQQHLSTVERGALGTFRQHRLGGGKHGESLGSLPAGRRSLRRPRGRHRDITFGLPRPAEKTKGAKII
jgi:hypothetical protein